MSRHLLYWLCFLYCLHKEMYCRFPSSSSTHSALSLLYRNCVNLVKNPNVFFSVSPSGSSSPLIHSNESSSATHSTGSSLIFQPSWNHTKVIIEQKRKTNLFTQNEPAPSLSSIVRNQSVQELQLSVFPNKRKEINSSLVSTSSSTNITFFPWDEDTIDYSLACNNLLRIFQSFKGPIIVNSGKYGGLGHKFKSLYNAILMSLLLQRPLYSILCRYFYIHS